MNQVHVHVNLKVAYKSLLQIKNQSCDYLNIPLRSSRSFSASSLSPSYLHSFRLLLYRLLNSSTRPTQRRSRHSTDTVPGFHAETPQATELRLSQGPNVTARAGVEPMALRTKGVDSTKAPSRPTTKLFNHV